MKKYARHKSHIDWNNMVYLNPGDKVWYPFIRTNIIVKATVNETNEIYDGRVVGLKEGRSTIWASRFEDSSKDYVSMATNEDDENGWPIHEHKPISFVKGLKPCNQFLWIDEPVGHGIQLGDECFLSLFEARNCVLPSRKKDLRIRLRQSRYSRCRFIASTWEGKHPGFDPYPQKKVYVR